VGRMGGMVAIDVPARECDSVSNESAAGVGSGRQSGMKTG
jgi:hypothetical protein